MITGAMMTAKPLLLLLVSNGGGLVDSINNMFTVFIPKLLDMFDHLLPCEVILGDEDRITDGEPLLNGMKESGELIIIGDKRVRGR